MADAEKLRQHIIESGIVLDPDGVHHEFYTLVHGQKLDFDNIADESPLYGEWVDVSAEDIRLHHDPLPEFVIGVANGTNRLALSVAQKLGSGVVGLETAKDPENKRQLILPKNAMDQIVEVQPELVVVVEDAGTSGATAVQVALLAKGAGARRVVVQVTWQRNQTLPYFDEAEVEYRAIIKELLPDFTPRECAELPEGFCSRGWDLVRRSS